MVAVSAESEALLVRIGSAAVSDTGIRAAFRAEAIQLIDRLGQVTTRVDDVVLPRGPGGEACVDGRLWKRLHRRVEHLIARIRDGFLGAVTRQIETYTRTLAAANTSLLFLDEEEAQMKRFGEHYLTNVRICEAILEDCLASLRVKIDSLTHERDEFNDFLRRTGNAM